MKLQNLRIGTRLGLGFGLLLVLLLVTLAASIGLNGRQQERTLAALQTSNDKERLANEMRASLLESAVAMRNVALDTEVAAFQRQADKARAERKRYAAARAGFEALPLSTAEQSVLDRVARLDKAVEQPFFQAVSLAQAMSTDEAIKVIATQIDPVQQQQIAAINQLQAMQVMALARTRDETAAASRLVNLGLLALAGLALLLGTAASWLCTKSITVPLGEAVRIAQRVTSGELALQIVAHGRDEAAQLLQSLRRMTTQLRSVVAGVHEAASDVTSASVHMARGNADLSERTESQASSLQQTATTMADLTVAVRKAAESARHASSVAGTAALQARQGGEVVNQVVRTMESINQSSSRIADINAVIDGIAFQTNILALNAAVEAARAGEQGRGFAVVAAEVRQLAQRSATAAKEIKQLITRSVEQTAEGSTLAAEAGRTMAEIVASVGNVSTIVSEIAAASHEQSVGIGQVNEAIAHLDDVTQQNARLVENARHAADGLRERADHLTRGVSVFQLEPAA